MIYPDLQSFINALESDGELVRIKEEVDPTTNQIIPKRYFSGGITKIDNLKRTGGDLGDQSMLVQKAVLNHESKTQT